MWEMTFEAQMEIWKSWCSPAGRRYGDAFVNDMRKKKKLDQDCGDWNNLSETQAQLMLLAEPIAIAEEMMELWEAAAKRFEPEPLTSDDLLTQHGFIYLPKPLYLLDVKNKRVSMRALAWSPTSFVNEEGHVVQRGIAVYTYTDINDDDDYNVTLRELFRQAGRKTIPDLSLSHMTAWGFGDTYEDVVKGLLGHDLYEGYKYEDAIRNVGDFWRQIQALFRLMQQKVTSHEQVANPRPTRRRAKRAGIEDKPVTVIRLRRAKRPRDSDHEPEDTNWSHRWLVGGHWRNQWYPSITLHRQIWINPYIKGPEDKELRIREKRAFELVR